MGAHARRDARSRKGRHRELSEGHEEEVRPSQKRPCSGRSSLSLSDYEGPAMVPARTVGPACLLTIRKPSSYNDISWVMMRSHPKELTYFWISSKDPSTPRLTTSIQTAPAVLLRRAFTLRSCVASMHSQAPGPLVPETSRGQSIPHFFFYLLQDICRYVRSRL